jgi:hypothetical protein
MATHFSSSGLFFHFHNPLFFHFHFFCLVILLTAELRKERKKDHARLLFFGPCANFSGLATPYQSKRSLQPFIAAYLDEIMEDKGENKIE